MLFTGADRHQNAHTLLVPEDPRGKQMAQAIFDKSSPIWIWFRLQAVPPPDLSKVMQVVSEHFGYLVFGQPDWELVASPV